MTSFGNLVTGTLGQQIDFGFGFRVIEIREFNFGERYPATSGNNVFFEKMTLDETGDTRGILRESQYITSELEIHELLVSVMVFSTINTSRSVNS